MKIGTIVLGGLLTLLASSSMALATCGSVCLTECEGEYGTDWQIYSTS